FRHYRIRNETAMGKVNVKNGTPVGNAHLCRTCLHGQYTTGYRETDVLVICANSTPAILVPFPVHECTDYWDRNRPSIGQMHKLALDFSDGRRKPVRGFSTAGFAAVADDDDNGEEEQEDEAALAR
ncbi:MAG: hypothetical protein ABR928_21875, partial [Terracidiphilus sp.]